MGLFEGLRLWSGRHAYLDAAEDGRSVRLDPSRASHNAGRDATPPSYPYAGTLCVPHRSAYGCYLGAPDATAPGSHCRAAKQRDFDKPEAPAIMSRAVDTSRQGAFLLQDATGRYLRANSRRLLPCRFGGCISTRGGLCTAAQCQGSVQRVPRAGRQDLPIPRDSEWGQLERGIRCVLAGVFGEDKRTSSEYTRRRLERQLVNLLPRAFFLGYTLFVRAGRYGQPSPRVVNLPRSREPLDGMPYGRGTEGSQMIYGCSAADPPLQNHHSSSQSL